MRARLDKRPSIERLRQYVAYDPETGALIWRITSGRAIEGRAAGGVDPSTGYHRVRIDGHMLLTHHVVWALVKGEWPLQLDHEDRDKSNNRVGNLRPATQQQNMGNMGRPRHNTSGMKGVSFHKATGKWQAQISRNGQHVGLGVYVTKEEAATAYEAAAKEHFGEFARAESR